MQEQDQLRKNMKQMETQMTQMASNNSVRNPGSLPGQPSQNESLKAIVTRSGKEYEAPLKAAKPKEVQGGEHTVGDEVREEEMVREKSVESDERVEKNKEQPTGAAPQVTPKLPFPSRVARSKADQQFGKFAQLVKNLQVTVPFTDLVAQVPAYTKFLKDILSKRRSFEEVETVALTKQCSVILQNRSTPKLKDPGSFTIPCTIGPVSLVHGLCDLGASVSVMPLSLAKK